MAQSFVVVATSIWSDLPNVVKWMETLGRFINAVRVRLALTALGEFCGIVKV
jgi:hypothetical protein